MKINRIKLAKTLSSAMQAVSNFTHTDCNVGTVSDQFGIPAGIVYKAFYGRTDIQIRQALQLKDFILCTVSELMDSK